MHDSVHATDDVGATILEALVRAERDGRDGAGGLELAVQALAERYDVDPALARSDAAAFRARLLAERGTEPTDLHVPDVAPVPERPMAPVGALELPVGRWRVRVRGESRDVLDALAGFFVGAVLEGDAGTVASGPTSLRAADVALDVWAAGGAFPIARGGATLDTGRSVSDAASKCHREIVGAVAGLEPRLAVMHAAAVARRDAALLFPAKGGAGKTTLAAWLVSEGWRLVNDDIVPVRAADGALAPIPAALSIKSGSWPILDARFPILRDRPTFGTGPRALRYLAPAAEQVRTAPVDCAAVVLPERSGPDAPAELVPVRPVEAVAAMVAGGCLVDRPFTRASLEAFLRWVGARPCLRLRYGDLDAARDALERWMDGRARDGHARRLG